MVANVKRAVWLMIRSICTPCYILNSIPFRFNSYRGFFTLLGHCDIASGVGATGSTI